MTKLLLLFVLFVGPEILSAQVSVLTQHNDLARTGANLHEILLNDTSVNQNTFGRIFSREVDDQIYAQPLIVSDLEIPSVGKKNVVFVATVNNTLYAFDGDDASVSDPYWQVNLTPPGTSVVKNTDMTGACGGNYSDFSGNIGIVGTPVIDTILKTIYLVSRDKVISNGAFEQWLHAIDITDGTEKSFSPILITAKYHGTGEGSVNDTITFDSRKQNQRPAITLVNGIIYIAWASHCDWGPYHGWVIGYDETTLQQKYVWMDTPTGIFGGIWMSGQGLSADEFGNLYLSTGNGTVGEDGDPADTVNRGESFLKLKPFGNSFQQLSFFTPANYDVLEQYDVDLGSQGLLLVPNTKWAIGGGKEGVVYVVNRDTMGGVDVTNHVIQEFSEGSNNQLHGGFVYWHSETSDYVYVWPSNQHLRAYRINYSTQLLDYPATMESSASSTGGQPGGMLSISSNGSVAGTGILWAALPKSGDANQETRPGILRAYNAANLTKELWNSEMHAPNDSIAGFAKFVCPTIANGKVYLATFSKHLLVYGLGDFNGIQNQNDLKSNGSLIPNPADNIIHIRLASVFAHGATVTIFNDVGIPVEQFSIEQTSFDKNVSSLSPGFYLVTVENENYRTQMKLVIDR